MRRRPGGRASSCEAKSAAEQKAVRFISDAQDRLEVAQIQSHNSLIAHAISFGRGPLLIFTDRLRDCMGFLLWTAPRRIWHAPAPVVPWRRVAGQGTSSVIGLRRPHDN